MVNFVDKISVIVPIYNVENYLKQCLDSIVNQTYKNLEIILIDDGSIDRSGKICDEYKLKDNRIKVIHKANEGLSAARNVGLLYATGEYISFIDSDDFIDINMYTILYNNINETKSDIVWCDYNIYIDKNNIHKHNLFSGKRVYEILPPYAEFAADLFNKYHLEAFVWNRLYKKEIFKNIRFPYKRKCEDGFMVIAILKKAKRISVIPEALYFYRKRNDSLSSRKQRDVQFKKDFTESRIIRAIQYNEILPNSNEANILLYRAYKIALRYINIISNNNKMIKKDIYKNVIYPEIKILLKSELSIKRKLSLILYLIKYKIID